MLILRIFQFCWVLTLLFITWVFGYELYICDFDLEKLDGNIVQFLLIVTTVAGLPMGILVPIILKAVTGILDYWLEWNSVNSQFLAALIMYCTFVFLGWLQWFFIPNFFIRFRAKVIGRIGLD